MDVTIKCTYWFYHHRFLSKLQAVAAKIASGRSKIYKRSQQNLQAVATKFASGRSAGLQFSPSSPSVCFSSPIRTNKQFYPAFILFYSFISAFMSNFAFLFTH